MNQPKLDRVVSNYSLVTNDIHKVIDILSKNNEVKFIEPASIASMVISLWQNGNIVDIRIKWAAVQEIKELAREILRKYEPCTPESEAYQETLDFKQLQAWYPLPGKEGKYWRLELLTKEEIAWNVERLRMHAKGCVQHADTLERYAASKTSMD